MAGRAARLIRGGGGGGRGGARLGLPPPPAGAALSGGAAAGAPPHDNSTSDGGGADGVLASGGAHYAYTTSQNPTGGNGDGNREVFLRNVATNTTTQLTSTTGSTQWIGDVTADGSEVLFTSNGNLTGGNADGNYELYHREVASGTTTQITDSVNSGFLLGDVYDATMSDDGRYVAFRSSGDFDDGSNLFPNEAMEIWLHDRVDDTTVQVTDSPRFHNNLSPSISADGTRIAFTSTYDHAGAAVPPTSFVHQVMLYDVASDTIEQISAIPPNTSGGFVPLLSISADGNRVAFNTFHDGATPQPNADNVVYDVPTDTTTSVQAGVSPSNLWNLFGRPWLSGDGQHVAFISGANYRGTNADLNDEAYRRNLATGEITQVTSTTKSHPQVTQTNTVAQISHDGSRLAVITDFPFLGKSNRWDDTYIFACGDATFSDVGVTHPFFADIEWMADSGISEGYENGTYRPSAAVTRQAMSAFMYRLAGEPPFSPPGSPSFSDVGLSHPFFADIEWMADSGISEGYENGTYRPSAAVTRQAMSAFMYRLAGEPAKPTPSGPSFTDVSFAHPFSGEIEWMAEAGISTGYQPGPTYRPSAAVSRQAMSAFMRRMAEGPGVAL